jgi:starvation-inducible DNA-binding protein
MKHSIVPSSHQAIPASSIAGPSPRARDGSRPGDGAEKLNQLMADTLALLDLYKNQYCGTPGMTHYILHLLGDQSSTDQTHGAELLTAEVKNIAGVTIAIAPDVVDARFVPNSTTTRDDAASQIARLLRAQQIVTPKPGAVTRGTEVIDTQATSAHIASKAARSSDTQIWFFVERTQ